MFLVNFVNDDEELLEAYEWKNEDCIEKFYFLPIYYVSEEQLHDFIYCSMSIDIDDGMYIVGDGHYCIVIDIKNKQIYRRGTMMYSKIKQVNSIIDTLVIKHFDYEIIQEAYEKEFGLTREERMKKICVEEVIDELFVAHYETFISLCESLSINTGTPSEKYIVLKNKLEKGYSSLHELLYKEYISKK